MPIIEQTPGWAGALAGLISAFGAIQGGKNAKMERERQAKIDAQNAALANAQLQGYNLQNQQTQQDIAQNKANQQFESGLRLPKGWAKMSPDQQSAYLNVRYNAAVGAHDPTAAAQTLGQINALGNTADRLALAQYTREGRLPLAQAQTANAKDAFQHAMQLLDERGKIQLQEAYIRALHSGRSGGASPAEKQNAAYIAALNEMSRTAYGAQIRGLYDEYNQNQSDYRGGEADNPPAQPNTTVVPMVIYGPGPNGQPVPHVLNPQPRAPKPANVSQPQQGGNETNPLLEGIGAALRFFTGGGGGGGQVMHHLSKSGKPMHSTDGGRTWHYDQP